MCARVSSRPRIATAGAGRLAIVVSASITEIALAASRCARWMVIVSVSTSRWTIYLTLATFTTASTFKPFCHTPRGRSSARKAGSLPSASSLGSFGITSASGSPSCQGTASLRPPSRGATRSACRPDVKAMPVATTRQRRPSRNATQRPNISAKETLLAASVR